jgi:UV DNA damage endonuclease
VKKGICCIVLALEEMYDPPKKFKTMTYKRFSELPRKEAISELSSRILNNMDVTYHAIKYCAENNHSYRLSSDLFPLITYKKADIKLYDLPNYNLIEDQFKKIKELIYFTNVRVSCHPSEFNVLASENLEAVDKTITELDFYGWFMTQIGCPLSYKAPMNVHINNSNGNFKDIANRFADNVCRLSVNVVSRLVVENDDKEKCWSVKKLFDMIHTNFNIPITFDYLHHKCHSDSLSERDAFTLAVKSWGNFKPLFHYSESMPDQKNPRKHADYATCLPNTYNTDIDLDFEFKMKEKSFAKL